MKEEYQQVPDSWSWIRIGELFTVRTGTTPPKKDSSNYSEIPTDCPFFKPMDLDFGANVVKAREWLSKRGEKYARLLPPMTVCVTSIGATIGKTGLLRVSGATNQQINAVLPDKSALPEFTFFYCCSPCFQKRVLEESSSTTLPIINKCRFEELEFPLPPLSEQRRIVAKLEKLLGKVDACQKRLEKIPIILKRFRQSVLAAACSGRLTEDWRKDNRFEDDLPAGWEWTPLEELLPSGGIFDGPFGSNLKTSDYTDAGVRVIRLENIGHLHFNEDKKTYISHDKYLSLRKHTVGEGDIIFASFIAEEIRALVCFQILQRLQLPKQIVSVCDPKEIW